MFVSFWNFLNRLGLSVVFVLRGTAHSQRCVSCEPHERVFHWAALIDDALLAIWRVVRKNLLEMVSTANFIQTTIFVEHYETTVPFNINKLGAVRGEIELRTAGLKERSYIFARMSSLHQIMAEVINAN